MMESRLADLASLSAERDISHQLSLEEVVDKFGISDRNSTIYSKQFTWNVVATSV